MRRPKYPLTLIPHRAVCICWDVTSWCFSFGYVWWGVLIWCYISFGYVCMMGCYLSIYQHICMWFQLNFVCHVAVQISVKYLFIFLLKYCWNIMETGVYSQSSKKSRGIFARVKLSSLTPLTAVHGVGVGWVFICEQ